LINSESSNFADSIRAEKRVRIGIRIRIKCGVN
jgi:hypothetical protein